VNSTAMGRRTGQGLSGSRWTLLTAAIASEVTGSLSLKAALGHGGWYAVVAAGYVASFLFFAAGLRRGLPLGVAYGIWGASGVVLTAVMAFLLFGEPMTPLMALGIALVVAGVLAVELGSRGHRP
jgi:small multidrug resistance pump